MRIGAVEMVVKKIADLRESGELPFIYQNSHIFHCKKGNKQFKSSILI